MRKPADHQKWLLKYLRIAAAGDADGARPAAGPARPRRPINDPRGHADDAFYSPPS
jgi:hypothetical protein